MFGYVGFVGNTCFSMTLVFLLLVILVFESKLKVSLFHFLEYMKNLSFQNKPPKQNEILSDVDCPLICELSCCSLVKQGFLDSVIVKICRKAQLNLTWIKKT